ncbi:hypothetical protein KGF42_19420, partial [Clostridioides sp. ZZV15-6383]|uniref:hypothetical protein n=1 Tax=Clostridioides sp. ZZV15-6383 TaxID=2811498 RepID=UPI001D126E03|nr:hypothetical protein [Clostridioides sp. ZZV15-6383]
LKIIGFDKPKDCLRRWRKIYLKQGEASLVSKSSRELNLKKKTSIKDELKRAKARIKYLEMENNFLKKIDALERTVIK